MSRLSRLSRPDSQFLKSAMTEIAPNELDIIAALATMLAAVPSDERVAILERITQAALTESFAEIAAASPATARKRTTLH